MHPCQAGDNSFLNQSASGKKVLVIVPHEDDEINVAGSLMYHYIQSGAEVFCAFTTNGDYSFDAVTRMKEAWRSLQVLGVRKIFFLGYGDTSNAYAGGHLFYATDKAVTSPAGHQETYSCHDFPDYAFVKRGQHSCYCRQNFKQDLTDLILDIRADLLVVVDCDVHADHRAASIVFEDALGDILRQPGNSYHPTVLKGFAYCTSFGAPKDFYADNIRSVPKPSPGDDIFIDTSLYEWGRRLRFPVRSACRGAYLRRNILYRALFQHASQSAALHAVRIANGDTVFWQRRTDNLVFQATVTASSGNAAKACDFKIIDTADIDVKKFVPAQYLWSPDNRDAKRCLHFQWSSQQVITTVSLAGNIEDSGRIEKVRLSFSDGTSYDIGPLPTRGRVLEYTLPTSKSVSACTLKILETTGAAWGLSEVGIFSEVHPKGIIPPFIKLLVGDDFVYDYVLPLEQECCPLNLYRCQTSSPVTYTVVDSDGAVVDSQGVVSFSKQARYAVIRGELADNPGIYDQIYLHRMRPAFFAKRRLLQWLEDKLLTFYLKKYRKYTHIRHKYLKQL
ncbi:PIG-L family deacetylase [Megasphaera massiliensis]|uniref:PIG-L family deacetylase n=3 Tax=Megasphaera massiliensis TaxID=1232428 RepID=UPI00041160CC|nr:PIG-L family deacetylase [Megasphaera massiliensis]MBS6255217.1 PIG-L family deacetylase [Megasphaera sp.]